MQMCGSVHGLRWAPQYTVWPPETASCLRNWDYLGSFVSLLLIETSEASVVWWPYIEGVYGGPWYELYRTCASRMQVSSGTSRCSSRRKLSMSPFKSWILLNLA